MFFSVIIFVLLLLLKATFIDEILYVLAIFFSFVISFYSIFLNLIEKKDNYFSKSNLIKINVIYSFGAVIFLNIVSFSIRGNYFIFSENDALFYHKEALKLLNNSFLDGFITFSKKWSIDDFGGVLYVYLCYFFIESNLFVNVVNILVGTITVINLYAISLIFMTKKYAFYAALSYGVSSFVLFFHASGLKESVMVMFVVVAFSNYLKFIKSKKIINVVYITIALVLLLLFRPALMFLLLGSIFFGVILKRKLNVTNTILVILGLLVLYFSYTYFEQTLSRFAHSDIITQQENQGMVKVNLTFTYIVNIIASVFGPLPTVFPASLEKMILSIYSPGLLFRVFIAVLSFAGIYNAITKKSKNLYPIIIFLIIELVSLVSILDVLELRKSLPHISFIYLFAFYYLDLIRSERMKMKKPFKTVFSYQMYIMVFLSIIIVFWNLR